MTDIGVIGPFRSQPDAVEAMLLETYPIEEIERLGLTVGTVHAFQGSERDVVVASLALGSEESAASRRFLEDPNLFSVLVTRARQRMIVVTSLPRARDGSSCPRACSAPGRAPEIGSRCRLRMRRSKQPLRLSQRVAASCSWPRR